LGKLSHVLLLFAWNLLAFSTRASKGEMEQDVYLMTGLGSWQKTYGVVTRKKGNKVGRGLTSKVKNRWL